MEWRLRERWDQSTGSVKGDRSQDLSNEGPVKGGQLSSPLVGQLMELGPPGEFYLNTLLYCHCRNFNPNTTFFNDPFQHPQVVCQDAFYRGVFATVFS